MRTGLRIEPGENSRTQTEQSRLELQLKESLKADFEIPKTPLVALEIAAEKAESSSLKSLAENLADRLDQVRQQLHQVGQDIVVTPAARALQRRQMAEKVVKELTETADKATQAVAAEIKSLETQLPSAQLPHVSESVALAYAQRIDRGELRLHELFEGSSEEQAVALQLTERYSRLLPETERQPVADVKAQIDRSEPHKLQAIEERRKAISALREMALKVSRLPETVAPEELIEEIKSRSYSSRGAA